jgi:putative transposase
VALKLVYLTVRQLFAWALLSRRDAVAKDAEILLLRHQLAVAQRRTPARDLQRRLTWADRAWPALLTGLLPKHRLEHLRLIVTPSTLLRWHRDLLRRRWAYRSLWEILASAGIEPAPRRDTGPSWAQFLRSQAEALLAADFVVIDLLDGTKVYVLAVIEHASRRVRVLGATAHPVTDWVIQQARNLLMDLEEADVRARFLIHDRDASFPAAFDQILDDAGITLIRSAIRAPRMNALIEHWFRSLRAELTDRTLIWNIPHLLRLLREYETFYNQHRPHRALGQAAPLRPLPETVVDLKTLRIRRHDHAGGILHEYQQVA